jgi:hypothetical protein
MWRCQGYRSREPEKTFRKDENFREEGDRWEEGKEKEKSEVIEVA